MPKLSTAELASLLMARRQIPFAHVPCRAARVFSSILDRPVTCRDAQDAITRIQALKHADQGLRNPPVRTQS